MNPEFDPLIVGPVAAAGNLYWAMMCIPLSASLWAVGMLGRLERETRRAWDGRDG